MVGSIISPSAIRVLVRPICGQPCRRHSMWIIRASMRDRFPEPSVVRLIGRSISCYCLALAVLLFSGTAQSQPCTSERIIREDGSHWDRVICPPPQSAPGEPVCHSGTLVVPCSPDYDPNYASTKPLTPKQAREYKALISAGIPKKDAKRVVRDPGVKKGEWGWDCDNKTAVRVRGAGAKYGSNVVCE